MLVRIALGVALVIVAAMVVAPGVAGAGGFSTVGLLTPPPEDLEAGGTWEAGFTVLTHGREPAAGMRPAVRIERVGGGERRTFSARETEAPGVYRARVAFPDRGRWSVAIAEHPGSFSVGHSFGEVTVAAAGSAGSTTAAGDGGLSTVGAVGIALLLGLLAGGAAWLAQAGVAGRSAAQTG